MNLIHGDCLRVMRDMPNSSIDLIVTDPPYYRVKGEAWDKQWDSADAYLAWLCDLRHEWARILKPNGSLYVFASPEMSARVELVIAARFNVLNNIRWVKSEGWHKKADKASLRSYLSPWEAIIFAEHTADATVEYLRRECKRAGLKPEDLSALLGFSDKPGSIAPRRYLNVAGFAPIAREMWPILQERTGCFSLDYDDVYRPFVIDPQEQGIDVWDFAPVQTYPLKHICEKPVALIRHIVRSSSRPGAVVFDGFMGSGVVAEVCYEEGRHFIGCDIDEIWVKRAENRVERAKTQPRQHALLEALA